MEPCYRATLTESDCPGRLFENPQQEPPNFLGEISGGGASSVARAEILTQAPSGSAPCLTCKDGDPDAVDETHHTSSSFNRWLPVTLHRPFLTILITLAILLGLLTFFWLQLLDYLQDNGSVTFFLSWRFIPTLVATIYAPFVSSLLSDVRRTEPFFRLSKLERPSPSYTVCLPARSWWHDPRDALSKSVNGGSRGWALFFASITYLFALLISPISAGLLSPVITQMARSAEFTRTTLPDKYPWQLNATDSIIFRTISGAILGKPASPWFSTEYAVLPYEPDTQANIVPERLPQQWITETLAYKVELDCLPLEVDDVRNTTIQYSWTTGDEALEYSGLLYQLSSADGCVITMQDVHDTNLTNAPHWVKNDAAWWLTALDPGPLLSRYGSGNGTRECGARTILAVKVSSNIQAQLCSAEFFMANVSANASVSNALSNVEINTTEFKANRKLMDQSHDNIRGLQTAFYTPSWSSKLLGSGNYSFAGPLLSLAASKAYNNTPAQMADRSHLLQQATKLYQQFLGEVISSTIAPSVGQGPANQSLIGRIMYTERLIVVNSAFRKALAIILILSGGFLSVVAYTTRIHRRALGIENDPGQIATVACLLVKDERTRRILEGLDRCSRTDLDRKLGVCDFEIGNGSLFTIGSDAIDDSHGENHRHHIFLSSVTDNTQELIDNGIPDQQFSEHGWASCS